mmetsp:Transcript_29521/g.59289  ORF Transcript_29521/g.59289 Transcript_29521/m.59289 type:complete len:163 (+) Transcript_29521:89-577(+)
MFRVFILLALLFANVGYGLCFGRDWEQQQRHGSGPASSSSPSSSSAQREPHARHQRQKEPPLRAEFTPSSSSSSSSSSSPRARSGCQGQGSSAHTLSQPHWLSDDPYRCLKLPQTGATKDSAKRQYHKLCLLYHPDKARHPQATEAFLAITKALQEVLRNVS